MHVREGKKGKAVCRSLVVLDQLVHHLPCPPWHVGDTGVWTNSQTGLLLFLRPRSSEAAAMVTRPDTVTGAGEQSLTRRALPSSRNTYCSLFLRAHTQTPQGTCHPPTLKAPDSPPNRPSDVGVITCFHYIFHAGANKARIGLWDRNREPNISTFIELSVTVRRSKKKKTMSIKQNVRQEQMSQDEEEEGWRKRWRGKKKWNASGGKDCHCKPRKNISTATAAATQPWVLFARFLIALLFMCVWVQGRSGVLWDSVKKRHSTF